MARIEKWVGFSLSDLQDQWNQGSEETWHDFRGRTDALMDKLIAVSKSVAEDIMKYPKASLIGLLLRFPVADGYAFYLVVQDKPLRLCHIPFGDGYRIPDAYIRGLRRSDILSHHMHQI